MQSYVRQMLGAATGVALIATLTGCPNSQDRLDRFIERYEDVNPTGGGGSVPTLCDTEPVTMRNLMGTIMHTLLDVGELRLTAGLPNDLLHHITAAEPIANLL